MKDELRAYDDRDYLRYCIKSICEKELRTLSGIIQGICFDNVVNEKEVAELKTWVESNSLWLQKKPFDVLLFHINEIIEDGKVDEDEIQDLLWLANKLQTWSGEAGDLVKEALQSLAGIFHGVLADREVTDDEINTLQGWIYDHDFLKGSYPYDEVESLVVAILRDKKITDDERKLLTAFMGEFIDFSKSENLSKERWLELRKKYTVAGICSTDPDIEFEGKLFCFTGESEWCSRSKIKQKIESAGGIFKNSVVKDTDFLVVGGKGNICWAFLKYGRKIEQAIEMRKKGGKIVIVHENDFWDAIEDQS